jgi:predicted nucleic acid-binding protein
LSTLFDTHILIDYLRGFPAATREVELQTLPLISNVSWIEVMAGAGSDSEIETVRQFLMTFECLPIDAEIAERAAYLRRTKKLKLPDALILATAQVAGAVLITRDLALQGQGPYVRIPYRI